MTQPVLRRVTTLELDVQPWAWPFAQARRAEISAHFAGKQREKPQLWDGRILLGRNPVFTRTSFSASYFETDFASFLAWRDWGFPDVTVFNGFGMGALRGCDGGFVLGEMAAHTANAGKIYFPSGTPDLNDLKSGRVDIEGSVTREVAEETGLTGSDYRPAAYWDCVVSGCLVAMMRILDSDLPADLLRDRIETNLAQQQSPEFSAMHVVRSRSDLQPAMPPHMVAFLENWI